ncbi:transcriptional regulator, Spx/MgsR family [Hydrobacter penzbergensis]|uniref:Transcriptional regulator, Spx/MgsR family n=2 Tax=Hydrobacter penzbergensis TaxID=1235997 RepID=A0A8X8LCQ1_9BACT|nr:transcriptional regulator, Spx/MgsR family [Hydrobacter penzbergensis]
MAIYSNKMSDRLILFMKNVKMYTIYGIPNCDTVKKTLNWLESHQVKYDFHDYKKLGIDKEKLQTWCKQVGWETILNKKSATWRELGADVQVTIQTEAKAIQVMMANTSIIKRPVIEKNGKLLVVGFNEKQYGELF